MSTYGPADTETAWYQDNYPGSTITPNCGVLHTTEGSSLPGYSGGASAPNYTAVPIFREARLQWFAHFPDEKSSRALRNLTGGVETNTLNVIQVELVGTCDPRAHADWTRKGVKHIFWPEAPDWALRDLARFMVDMKKRHNIPLDGPRAARWVAYPESYGEGGQRFTFAEWRAFQGWCGHQHVPENTHGDPGALDFPKLLAIATELTGKPPKTPDPELDAETPRWDRIWELADLIVDSTGNPGKKKAARTIKDAAGRYSAAH